MQKFLWFSSGFIMAMIIATVAALTSWRVLEAESPAMPQPLPTRLEPTPEPTREPTARPTPALPSAALNWRREGGLAGRCDRLAIDARARLFYAPCDQGQRYAPWSEEELKTYQGYLERYQPFEYDAEDNPGGADSLAIHLSMAGHGSQVASRAEQAEVAAWAGGVYARLSEAERRDEMVARARLDLAGRLGIYADTIVTRAAERVTWDDACLGIKSQGLFCAQVATPGYRIVLQVEETLYEYHSDLGDMLRAVENPRS